MKIIHISDLHYPDSGENPIFLIKKIIKHYSRVKQKPLVILTGDIVDTTTRKRYFKEAKMFLEELINKGFKLLICPGNHDLKAFGAAPIISGRIRFDNYFKSLLPKGYNYYGDEDNNFFDFPMVNKFSNHYFIGLDSMAAEWGPGTTGELGDEQLTELKEILEEIRSNEKNPIITVYLHHHPLKFTYRPRLLRLKDKKKLLTTIKGINILLFGHIHFNERFSNDEKKYDINCIFLTGGSAYGKNVDWTEIDTRGFKTKLISYPIED